LPHFDGTLIKPTKILKAINDVLTGRLTDDDEYTPPLALSRHPELVRLSA